MSKYLYVGNGQYIQGLPALDIDDEKLTDEQKKTLAMAVEMGLYKADGTTEVKPEETSTTEISRGGTKQRRDLDSSRTPDA